jgi:hypothetical protein
MLRLSPPKEGETGEYPSIATLSTRNIVVCAYEGVARNLYFRVGDVQHDTINWKKEISHGSGGYVKVGLFEKSGKVYIITVYGHDALRYCYYQINELSDDGKITFNDPKLLCSGIKPTLAVRKDGTVVVVVEDKLTYTLRCYVGKINDSVSEITWRESPDTFPNSTTPSVAINDKNNIILFYRREVKDISSNIYLKYSCGLLTDSITWKVKNQDYNKGIHPNVTVSNDQVVIVTYMSPTWRHSLYFGYGTLNSKGEFMVKEKSCNRGMGMHPAVSISEDNRVVEIHKSNSGTRLWVSQGIYTSYEFALYECNQCTL